MKSHRKEVLAAVAVLVLVWVALSPAPRVESSRSGGGTGTKQLSEGGKESKDSSLIPAAPNDPNWPLSVDASNEWVLLATPLGEVIEGKLHTDPRKLVSAEFLEEEVPPELVVLNKAGQIIYARTFRKRLYPSISEASKVFQAPELSEFRFTMVGIDPSDRAAVEDFFRDIFMVVSSGRRKVENERWPLWITQSSMTNQKVLTAINISSNGESSFAHNRDMYVRLNANVSKSVYLLRCRTRETTTAESDAPYPVFPEFIPQGGREGLTPVVRTLVQYGQLEYLVEDWSILPNSPEEDERLWNAGLYPKENKDDPDIFQK
jgi:hypothetical protein